MGELALEAEAPERRLQRLAAPMGRIDNGVAGEHYVDGAPLELLLEEEQRREAHELAALVFQHDGELLLIEVLVESIGDDAIVAGLHQRQHATTMPLVEEGAGNNP